MNNTPETTITARHPFGPRTLIRRATALALSTLTLLTLAGCHYSLLNRSSSLAAWSPDGSRLAVCIVNNDAGCGELWLVEPDSGATRKLLSGDRSSGQPHLVAPRWSPDGRQLYCLRTIDEENEERRPATIVHVDPRSGEASDLGVIHYKNSRFDHLSVTDVFTPLGDGSIAAQNLGEDEIFRLVRIDSERYISSFATIEGSWMVISGSQDGERLAVAVPGSKGMGTVLTFFDNKGEPLLDAIPLWPGIDQSGSIPALTWSPCSHRLALVAENVGEQEEEDFATLMVVDSRTGEKECVASDLFGLPPVFSPDGNRLAFTANSEIKAGDDDLLLEVRIHPPVGDAEVELSLPGLALPLAWSADSSKLAYYLGYSGDDNEGTVISVAPDGTGTRVVSQHQQDRLAVAAPTGGRLAWVSGDGAVQILDPGTGQVLFHAGLTVNGTLQAGEDHIRQGRPADALATYATLDNSALNGERSARLAAVSYAALNQLQRSGEAAAVLDRACADLPQKEDPPLAFLILGGALSDFGFRSEAEHLVEEQLLIHYPDSPEAVEALYALAALKQSEGDTGASLHHLQRLLLDYPEERAEPTRALLLATLARAGEEPSLILELAGLILETNGDPENVDQAVPRAVSYYARGRALEQNGAREQAREAYSSAITEDTDTQLPDGAKVTDLCWEALLRMARNETPEINR